MQIKQTSQPPDADVSLVFERGKISKDDHAALSYDLMQSINASLSARAVLEENIKQGRYLYDMVPPETEDDPWPGASNIVVPVIPAQVDSTLAYIIARTLVPRFFIVTGNTEPAQQSAYQVERYYSVELVKQRGRTTWYEELANWMHLALLDGTGYLEATWQRIEKTMKISQRMPMVSEDGVPIIDEETGETKTQDQVSEVKVIVYDDVRWTRRQLKDVGLVPATAPSIQDAAAVWIVEWPYESDLMALMADSKKRKVGQWFPEMVERALSYVDSGVTDDTVDDRQGNYDKNVGEQVQVGPAQGSQTSKFFKQRGPIKVFRIHSNQYDMDEDGEPEECVFYYHDKTQMLLGWMPYEYLIGERPIFEFSAYPRPMEATGYSLPQRLGPLTAEISKMYNDRNNAVDIKTSPPRIRRQGAKLIDNERQYGPGVEWEGEPDAVTFVQAPEIPTASFQQEALTKQYITELTGQNQPAQGAQSSGRRTATENRIQSAATGTRNDLIVMRFRVSCRALINFTHRLKLQYMHDQKDQTVSDGGGSFTINKQVLGQDYRIDVSGASDPLDAATRLSQDMGIYQMLAQDPDVQQDPVHRYYLKRKLLEDAGTQNIDQIIGTAEEAMQKKQAMAQQAQAQQAAGMPPGGAPPPGQQQQGGKPK